MSKPSDIAERLRVLEERLDDSEAANKALAAKNHELTAEITRLRPPAPRTGPVAPRLIDGQGPAPINSAGERIVGEIDPRATTVGTGSFGIGPTVTHKTLGDGRRIPVDVCGIPRAADGTVMLLTSTRDASPVPPGPSRSASHQIAVDLLDRGFPLHGPGYRPDDD